MTRPSEQPPFNVLLGERVRMLRLEQELSQAALAAASGVSRSAISRLEGGDPSMNIDSLDKLARALGMELLDFLNAGVDEASILLESTRKMPPAERTEALLAIVRAAGG